MNIKLKYLNLLPFGGRGGVVRFFMLSHDIAFEEELIAPGGPAWADEKKRLIESGENPCGTVPVTYLKAPTGDGSDDHILTQHISMCRYLARSQGLTSSSDHKDYVQDVVADEYQGFRDLWVSKFSATDEEKATYRTETLPELLKKFNALYTTYKTADVYLSTSASTGKPLWGDAAVFGLLYDHILSGHIQESDLSSYPNLDALYKAYGAIPAVASWIEAHKKK